MTNAAGTVGLDDDTGLAVFVTGAGTGAAGLKIVVYYACQPELPGKYSFARIIEGSGMGNQGLPAVRGVTCDSAGNIYMCGWYDYGTATIRDQNGTSLGTLTSPLGVFQTGFMSKFDASGNYVYSRILDASSYLLCDCITCDLNNGNVYVGGSYNGTATIRDQNGTSLGTLPAYNAATAFMCKFDASGNYLYSRILDANSNDITTKITCDPGGKVYMSGWYDRAATIRDQNGTPLGTLPSISKQTAFMCKFGAAGNYLYSRIIEGSYGDVSTNFSCDSDYNVYMVGYYFGPSTIKDENGTPLGTLPVTGESAAFMCKFDALGNYLYSRVIDSVDGENARGVACDSSGNVYVGGNYTGMPVIRDQNGTPLGTLPFASNQVASFLCKFDSSGNYLYSRIIDSDGNQSAFGVTCDSNRNVYMCGWYDYGTPIIKDQNGTPLGTLPAPVFRAGFMCKFNSSGNYIYTRILDGNVFDETTDVTCDFYGNVYMAGYYNITATIGDQNGTTLGTLPSVLTYAGYIIRFRQ
jgi:sugar lactone lactonase YvrE